MKVIQNSKYMRKSLTARLIGGGGGRSREGEGLMYKAKTAFWNDGSVITNPAAAQQK